MTAYKLLRFLPYIFLYLTFNNIVAASDSNEWSYDPSSQYDIYYNNSERSIYNKIYNNKFIKFDSFIVNKLILEQAKNKKDISILDFGAGNGRHFPIFFESANILNKQNKFLTLIAYDPSEEALRQYGNILTNLKFEEITLNTNPSHFKTKTYRKDNFTVKLIQPLKIEHIYNFRDHINNVDITLCLFGVLSHVQKKVERVATLKILYNMTNSKLFLSYPSYKVLNEERIAFETLRKNNINFQINHKVAKFEKGDLVYARNSENGIHIENFFHVYENLEEVKQELKLAGIEPESAKYGINKIGHETTLIHYPILGYIDYFIASKLSAILPTAVINRFASYYSIELDKY